jgi:hypothetical protein
MIHKSEIVSIDKTSDFIEQNCRGWGLNYLKTLSTVSPAKRCDLVGMKLEKVHKVRICAKGYWLNMTYYIMKVELIIGLINGRIFNFEF